MCGKGEAKLANFADYVYEKCSDKKHCAPLCTQNIMQHSEQYKKMMSKKFHLFVLGNSLLLAT